MPSKRVVRVVWNQARLVDAIRLGELDARVVLQCLKNSVPCGFRDFEDPHVDLVNGVVLLRAVHGEELLQSGFVQASPRLNQNATGHGVGGRSVENAGKRQRQNKGEKLPDGFKDGENAPDF